MAYLAVMVAVMAFLLALYLFTSDLRQCLLLGIGILIVFEGTVLMKFWFWIMHGKIATARELKLVQLAVAELKVQLSAAPSGAAPAPPAASAPTPPPAPRTTTRAPGKWWGLIFVALWLLAVAGLVYWGTVGNPHEPRDVTPYLEKIVPGEAEPMQREWEQSFEVSQARQRFYPRLVPAGKNARVWLSVAAEGQEPMFTGPVEPGSRISFGHPAPGRYVVKGRTEQADGGFTLRIGGVDEVPGNPSPIRLFMLMLSAAVTAAIPLVWLQGLWLRRVDPEVQA